MKEILNITDKKVLDLISDPFTMDIISVLGHQAVSLEKIAEDLEEKPSFIANYIDDMVASGLLTEVEDGYKITAKSIHAKELLLNAGAETASNWISGFINHMENSLVKQFQRLDELRENDKEAASKYVENYRLSHSQLYLSEEEIKELHELLNDFIMSKPEEERASDPEYQKCRFFTFFYPEI